MTKFERVTTYIGPVMKTLSLPFLLLAVVLFLGHDPEYLKAGLVGLGLLTVGLIWDDEYFQVALAMIFAGLNVYLYRNPAGADPDTSVLGDYAAIGLVACAAIVVFRQIERYLFTYPEYSDSKPSEDVSGDSQILHH